MNTIIGKPDLQRIAEELHSTSAKVAQEIFLTRRNAILTEIRKLTGQDYTEVIPAIKKGRPSKQRLQDEIEPSLVDSEQEPD